MEESIEESNNSSNHEPETTLESWSANPKRIQFAATDAVVVIAFLIAVVLIMHVQNTRLNIAEQPYPQIHLETISNPLLKKENMTLLIEMYSRTFAATDGISVHVTLYPNDYERAAVLWNNTTFKSIDWPNVVYIIRFENTYCNDEENQFKRCIFELRRRDNSPLWTSDPLFIRYSVGGGHDISLFEKGYSEIDTRQGRLPSQVGKPFIQIDSIAAINSIEQAEKFHAGWKDIATIAIIAAFVAVVAVYQRIRKTLLWRFGEFR
jgi:hypothetical protein